MLYTRNAFLFRKFYKEKIAREKSWLDLNFVGSLHPNKQRTETGFAKLIYGNREDLGKLLGTIALNVAADDQAIYELIQNADDCNSSFFSVSYNEKYLLCINNGNYFSDQDMSAIINVAGNYKDGEDIGTFGIGFKILHRLVGADDGREAIINDYAGPIIFSWNKFFQLEKFLQDEEIKVGYNPEKDSENPWLVKLLYTCFPSSLSEKIRLSNYDSEDVKFKKEELAEMRDFLKSSLQNVNLKDTNNLNSGSIFFLKLGEGKSKFLNDGIDKIKSGLSYSFKFLNKLKKIYINGEEIKSQRVSDYSNSFLIDSPEFNDINPKNKKRDIKFTLAYYRDYKKAILLRDEIVPNLYTFFSMDEEKNGFNFLLHCNAFDMNNDRRKLQANSQINEKLLPAIANSITQYIDVQKTNRKDKFLSLYANLLLSKEPKGKTHINNYFFTYLNEYINQNIPTINGYSESNQNVKIKNTHIKINPSDIGCSEMNWFCWYNDKEDDILIKEAQSSNKLGLEKWNIIDLFKYAIESNKLDHINNWIKQLEIESFRLFNEEKKLKLKGEHDIVRKIKPYYTLLSELNNCITKSNLKFISQIELFKFSDNNLYSLNEIFNNNNLVLSYNKTFDIRYELQSIGIEFSFINIEKYSKIKELIENRISDLDVFQQIASKTDNNELRKDQKSKIFLALTELNGVGDEKLKDLKLFKNTKGNVQPLRNLIKGDLQVANWLFPYKIHIAEYIPELDKFLLSNNDIYRELIFPNWDTIISIISNISEFYEDIAFYYNQDETNTPFKSQKFIYINKEVGFISRTDHFFYNPKIKELRTSYFNFKNATQSLLNLPIPEKQILSYFERDPFKIEKSNILDSQFAEQIALSIEEIKSILTFCKLNNEQFFKNYIIKKGAHGFTILSKTSDKYQISSPDKETRCFIDTYCTNKLFVLPSDLINYKDEDGVIKADDLHSLILDCIDVNLHKESLVDIVKYKAKYKFLNKLSEFVFSSDITSSKNDFEYKILELACSELKESDYSNFQNKVKITTSVETITLSAIPPFTGKVKIEGIELNLSEILPSTYQNSDILSNLIDSFAILGLSKDKLNSLFGVSTTTEPEQIFSLLSEEFSILENSQQLVFLILYNNLNEVNFKKFKVNTIDNKNWQLIYSYYCQPFSFIDNDYILKSQYADISRKLNLPVNIGSSQNQILKEPHFTTTEFICPCIKSELTEKEQIDFIEFLYNKWGTEKFKSLFGDIDWNIIDGNKVEGILGFTPKYSVYPNDFAYDDEKLPEYIINWVNNDSGKINFLSDIGVWVQTSTVIELRKYFIGELEKFSNNRLAQETRFNNDESILFNTFKWIEANNIQIASEEQFETFQKAVEVINSNRSTGDLKIDIDDDFEKLKNHSTEWSDSSYKSWKAKAENNFSIYLYEKELPKKVGLNEIKDYIFYKYNEGDIIIDDKNCIYLHSNIEIKKALQKLASDDKNEFTFEHLWDLLGSNTDEVVKLQGEIAFLKKQLQRKSDAQLGSGFDNSTNKDNQIEANREAKEILKERLEDEGYIFTQGVNGYSTINGVEKNNVEFPLVVKSYKWQNEPFKIGANEWLQLMKPNSMLWVHFGNRQLGCLKLNELLKKQDNLTLSFSTENLDYDNRIANFAELLHYFENVHFDFRNIKLDNYTTANSLKDYRFDERILETDLSSDDDSLM